jgi:hypothetical protein
MASGFSGSEGSISAGGEGERLMGLSIFFVSATDVGVSTEVSASAGTEGSTGTGGSTDAGDEVCVSGVLESGLSAIRLSLVVAGADWGFCGFCGFFAAIRKCVSLRL